MPKNSIKAVLISDIHFSLNTLELASESLKVALIMAETHKVPLIIAGDLHDTKAMIRAECSNEIIKLVSSFESVRKLVLVGNHDLINEKAKEDSLHFLNAYCDVVRVPTYDNELGLWLIPYFSDTMALKDLVTKKPSDSDTLRYPRHGDTLIMHQGLHDAHMGAYVVDKSSLPPETFDGFRVISGHYHRTQTIPCGSTGLWTYIGTPYSITFAEAHDGPKGFQLLHTDGSLTQVPLKLRKHVVVEREAADVLDPIEGLNPHDLLWIKVNGPTSVLDKLDKKAIGMKHLGHQNFKLDKIYSEAVKQDVSAIEALSDDLIIDKLIEDSEETESQKIYLKSLWREFL